MDPVGKLRAAVHRDPAGVAAAASELIASARAGGDHATLSGGLAVRGRARRSLGQIDLAEADLRAAILAARDHESPELEADALIGLAGVLSYAGRTAEARSDLDTALRIGSPAQHPYVHLQRSIIEQRSGDLPAALAGYTAALPGLRRLGADTDVALVLMNLGVIRTQSGDCDAAVADLSEAAGLFAAGDNGFGVAQCWHGLGWAHARRGDLPLALSCLDDATARFRSLGHAAPEVDVDRIEVLLAAGLADPALELAGEVAARLSAAGNHSQAAETWLLCARAAALLGDRETGAAFAARARDTFAAQGAAGWERAARLELLRTAGQHLYAAELLARSTELRAMSTDLAATGNARGALTALAMASVAASQAGDVCLGTELARECARRAARIGVFDVRILARHAGALAAEASGDRAAARRHVRAGLADLRRHRAPLATTDARASIAEHTRELGALGLRLAVGTGSAGAVLGWMERAAVSRELPQPVRPPRDRALAAGLASLRAVTAELREREFAGGDTVPLLQRQRGLEREIQRRQLRTVGDAAGHATRPVTAGALRAALGDGVLIELADCGGRLVAVRVGAGRPVLADCGPLSSAVAAGETLTSALRAAAMRGGGVCAPSVLGRATAALNTVLAPLAVGGGPVVLVVPSALQAVPWSLLPCLRGRPVALAPSATWWHTARLSSVGAGQVGSAGAGHIGGVLAVAGPRLAEAEREAAEVAACHTGATLLTGQAATAAAVAAALPSARLAHIACHGRVRRDNPLWSELELAEGSLYVHDLEWLARTPPTVVLSGCETGVGVRAGDQLIGLAAALLRRGTVRLVASVCVLPDRPATREVMTELHSRIARGGTPASALAALAADGPGNEIALLAACLACFGID